MKQITFISEQQLFLGAWGFVYRETGWPVGFPDLKDSVFAYKTEVSYLCATKAPVPDSHAYLCTGDDFQYE